MLSWLPPAGSPQSPAHLPLPLCTPFPTALLPLQPSRPPDNKAFTLALPSGLIPCLLQVCSNGIKSPALVTIFESSSSTPLTPLSCSHFSPSYLLTHHTTHLA